MGWFILFTIMTLTIGAAFLNADYNRIQENKRRDEENRRYRAKELQLRKQKIEEERKQNEQKR